MRADQEFLLPDEILIFGCGGHARSVADIILAAAPHTKILFFDEGGEPGERVLGFPVLSTLPGGRGACILALGDNKRREELWKSLQGESWIRVIAPSSHRGHLSEIGRGCFVGSFAHIGPEARIGENTIINTGAIIEHEVVIGSHSHVAPNATIAGRSQIGDRVFIGAGATVRDSVKIGSDVIIGAGAVVVKNLLEPGCYVGLPAQALERVQVRL